MSKNYKISVQKYEKMLNEWIYNLIQEVEYDKDEKSDEILKTTIIFSDGTSGETISKHERTGEVAMIDRNFQISTNEIINEEFRGVFEQCFEIDEYLKCKDVFSEKYGDGDNFPLFVKKLQEQHSTITVEPVKKQDDESKKTPKTKPQGSLGGDEN